MKKSKKMSKQQLAGALDNTLKLLANTKLKNSPKLAKLIKRIEGLEEAFTVFCKLSLHRREADQKRWDDLIATLKEVRELKAEVGSLERRVEEAEKRLGTPLHGLGVSPTLAGDARPYGRRDGKSTISFQQTAESLVLLGESSLSKQCRGDLMKALERSRNEHQARKRAWILIRSSVPILKWRIVTNR